MKNHILGYSKVLQKYSEGLNWILEHGEENLDKFNNKNFKNWYHTDKPTLFQYLNILEEQAQLENLKLCFFVYPIQVRVSYGFETLPEVQSLSPDWRFSRDLKEKRPDLNQRDINQLGLLDLCKRWQSELSFMSNQRLAPFVSKDSNMEKRLPLLKGSLDLQNLQTTCNNLQVILDKISES